MEKLSHEKMMEKAWKFIADMEIVEEKESLTDTGYLVGSLHQVRDAYYTDLESGHDFADEDMEGFFRRHSISYQTN